MSVIYQNLYIIILLVIIYIWFYYFSIYLYQRLYAQFFVPSQMWTLLHTRRESKQENSSEDE